MMYYSGIKYVFKNVYYSMYNGHACPGTFVLRHIYKMIIKAKKYFPLFEHNVISEKKKKKTLMTEISEISLQRIM